MIGASENVRKILKTDNNPVIPSLEARCILRNVKQNMKEA